MSSLFADEDFDLPLKPMPTESGLKLLEALISKEPDHAALAGINRFYENNGSLSPKQALIIMSKANAARITVTPSDFPVLLDKPKFRAFLEQLPTWKLGLLEPLLTPEQHESLHNVIEDKIYDHTDTVLFGKYSCKTIQEIMDTDPEYIEWLVQNVGFQVTPEVRARVMTLRALANTPTHRGHTNDGKRYQKPLRDIGTSLVNRF